MPDAELHARHRRPIDVQQECVSACCRHAEQIELKRQVDSDRFESHRHLWQCDIPAGSADLLAGSVITTSTAWPRPASSRVNRMRAANARRGSVNGIVATCKSLKTPMSDGLPSLARITWSQSATY
jgi:hypothetical protein